jgi:hypothetical protein
MSARQRMGVESKFQNLTSIFRRSSRPIRLLCISWYASSASRRLSYSTNAKLQQWSTNEPWETRRQ